MSGNWLEIERLDKNFDGIRALMDFSCTLGEGEILGLIGPNGAGKTTLFNVLSGYILPEHGKILKEGVDLTGMAPHRIANFSISRTFQNLRLVRQSSILDNVLLSYREQPGENLANLFFHRRKWLEVEKDNLISAMKLLDEAGLADKASGSAEGLSYGQQKLLSLVCCFAANAKLLLLDEPVAGIAPEMIKRILEIISSLPSMGKSVILIEHNLDAVMQVCDRVIFMDAGAKISEGTPEEVRNDPRVMEAYIG